MLARREHVVARVPNKIEHDQERKLSPVRNTMSIHLRTSMTSLSTALAAALLLGACGGADDRSAVQSASALALTPSFEFSEGSGTTTSSNSGEIGTLVGDIEWTTRQPNGGGAVNITGQGHVTIPASPAIKSIKGAITVCANVNARSNPTGDWGAIVSRQHRQDAGIEESYGIYIHKDRFGFVSSDGNFVEMDTPFPLNA